MATSQLPRAGGIANRGAPRPGRVRKAVTRRTEDCRMSLLRFHGVRRSAWVALWMSAGAVAIVGCGGEATTDAESTTATASALTDEKEQAICNQLLVPENAMLHAPCGSYKETCTNGTAWGIYGDQFCEIGRAH